MRNIKFFIILALILVFSGIYVNQCSAIPYWGRKYRTECHTCHFHFPKLTALGEAFRKLGYRFPDGPYEERVQDKSIHKGALELLPVSFDLTTIAELERDEGISFNDFGGDFLILSGGTINSKISFYGSLNFFVDGDSDDIDTIIPRMNVMYRPFRDPFLQIKVGRFEPRVLGVSNFRTITPAFGILNKTVGDNEWNLEPYQQGIELSGILAAGRVAYNAGLVEGRGNKQNDFKDFYGRLEYKFSGLRLDGTQEGEPFSGFISDSWKDNSLTIGVFGYHGEADLKRTAKETVEFAGIDSVSSQSRSRGNIVRISHTPGLGGGGHDDEEEDEGGGFSKEDRFFKVGADVNWFWGKLNVLGGYALQHHDAPLADDINESITEHQAFAEVDYAFNHWFEPTIRYEAFLQENNGEMLQRIQPQLNFHLGETLHLFISEDFVKDSDDKGFNATTGIAGFDIVF